MKSFIPVAALASSVAASPFSFPLQNGFPKPSMDALKTIQVNAGGSLPNSPLPKSISPELTGALQLIAANEIFEVAYFTELFQNVTNSVPGYEVYGEDRKFIEDTMDTIRNQEQLHALGANAILESVGQPTVGTCKYSFPVADFDSAIALANTFTDVVLGVLPAVQTLASSMGGADGAALVPLVGAILGQEAEQVGYFRTLQSKMPSAAPFLSPNAPEFALSAIKMFLVPGSCGPEYTALEQKIKSFPGIQVAVMPTPSTPVAAYLVDGPIDPSKHKMAYISGQNEPVMVDINNFGADPSGLTYFSAPFPAAAKSFGNGLTTAAVVKSGMMYSNITDVVAGTVYGPGLIEYQ